MTKQATRKPSKQATRKSPRTKADKNTLSGASAEAAGGPTTQQHQFQDLQTSPSAQARTASLQDLQSIQETAYFLAEKRGFEPGHELDDWLAAKTIVEKNI